MVLKSYSSDNCFWTLGRWKGKKSTWDGAGGAHLIRTREVEEDTKPKNTALRSRQRVSWHQGDQSLQFLLRATFGALLAMSLFKIPYLEFWVTQRRRTIHLNPAKHCVFPQALLLLLLQYRLQQFCLHLNQNSIDQAPKTMQLKRAKQNDHGTPLPFSSPLAAFLIL